MESNWRFNIWKWGYWGSDWQLCARYLGPTVWHDLLIVSNGDGTKKEYVTTAPGQLPAFWTSSAVLPGHFPWGLDVEPDHT